MSASLNFPKIPQDWNESSLEVKSPKFPGKIFVRIYHKKELSKARMLFIVHGQAEQSDRYEHFAHYLQHEIDMVAAVDLQGHGKSEGIRGHIENYDEYSLAAIETFNAARDWYAEKSGKTPVCHWFGHSMGGLITLRTHIKFPNIDVKSVIVSAPFLGFGFKVPPIKAFFSKLVEPVLGSLKAPNGLNAEHVSRDKSVSDYYGKNPLNHHYVTPRWFVQTVKEHEFLAHTKGPFPHDLLMIVPLGDLIVNYRASLDFYNRVQMAPGKKKVLTMMPGYYHESFNDIGKERPFNALAHWLMN